MASTTDEDRDGNGASASEASIPQGEDGVAAILAMVTTRALDHRGGLVLDSASLDQLRKQETREQVLREFVIAMMPDRVNPTIWTRWLQGGASPFDRAKLAHVDPSGQSISRALERQSRKVARATTGVHNARRAVEAAQRKLEEAEREQAAARSLDAGFIEWAISEHLLSIMAPMFAMGPAWTVMRAVSGHVTAEAMAEELSLIKDPRRRAEREQAIRQERQEGTEGMLDVLDFWAGDTEFEHEIREAIEGVTTRYAKRDRPEGQRRTRAQMKKGLADPELKRERDDILGGMKRSGG